MSGLTVIVPAYNEEVALGSLLPELMSLALTRDFDVIVVDDGSYDRTAQVSTEAGARVIRHSRNRGYGAAIKSGVRAAGSELLVFLDADGQHDPEDIARLVEAVEAGADMAVGTRRTQDPGLVGFAKRRLTDLAEYLVDTPIPDLNSGFRAVKRSRVEEFIHILPNGFSLSTTLTMALLSAGYEVAFTDIAEKPRAEGESRVDYVRDGLAAFLLVIRVITLFNPLKVFVPPAAGLTLLGAAYLAWDIILHFNVPTGSVLLILAGIQLFFFGVLADQISAIRRQGRIYTSSAKADPTIGKEPLE